MEQNEQNHLTEAAHKSRLLEPKSTSTPGERGMVAKYKPDLANVVIPEICLLGPGPANLHPAVQEALGKPQLGYLDPVFVNEIMPDVCNLIRYAFQTENECSFAVTGTGMTAWETVMSALIEPDDVVLAFVNGFFGERCLDMIPRYGGKTAAVRREWGRVFDLESIEAALREYKPQLVWICHAETSTGTLQPMEGVGDLCHKYGALLVVDCVTSLGTSAVLIDTWGADAAYSCSQKGLSCVPGISPVTFGPKALSKVEGKIKRPDGWAPWTMDLELLRQYYWKPHRYHHTASTVMWLALRAALTALVEEGLEDVWQRHKSVADGLYAELKALGFECFVEDMRHRTPALSTMRPPRGIQCAELVRFLRKTSGIEVGRGLGALADETLRIGLMGFNARPENVERLVVALRSYLEK